MGTCSVQGRATFRPPSAVIVAPKPPFALRSFQKEIANVAGQYMHWLTGSLMRLEEIPAGGGAVLRCGVKNR